MYGSINPVYKVLVKQKKGSRRNRLLSAPEEMSGAGVPDFFYREAQRLGYVARSAFKVIITFMPSSASSPSSYIDSSLYLSLSLCNYSFYRFKNSTSSSNQAPLFLTWVARLVLGFRSFFFRFHQFQVSNSV